ncbi:carboxypeptidase-like regulatory domain-containing protein [Flavobacterium sp. SM15]|uniref:carboxypeptidase-like regulatory domain-containing protein n=1 Tax=Flavobacterium sp. SM15 TaxID=2908005 RepID=UPI001EDA9744|nr:carboxypeptidase-like regulatory domain-containing protein [Flavobacterium sp. SM15]MCG2610378.1 carboxypeptidase-like regulatory domain-containing protein [Flavobacterium sp. SM15]
MNFQKITILLLLTTGSAVAQIKGVVKDSLTRQPIPYVSIWVENETQGTTSEEDGSFYIHPKGDSKTLIFSTLGYEKVRRKGASTVKPMEILLSPKSVALKEMVISKWKGTKHKEIGETDNGICQAFDNAPNIDLKYFPYLSEYKKTKFIKRVAIYTDCRIDNASIKLHFYSVGANGFPGEELLQDDYIVTVKKGVGKSSFNISELGLKMPENGIYVGFEKLMIEKNRTDIRFYPLVLYNYVTKDFVFVYSGGKWMKKVLRENASEDPKRVYEPAINLTLTN